MSKTHPELVDSGPPSRFVTAALVRGQPDDEEEEEDEEDDEEDGDDGNSDGYSE